MLLTRSCRNPTHPSISSVIANSGLAKKGNDGCLLRFLNLALLFVELSPFVRSPAVASVDEMSIEPPPSFPEAINPLHFSPSCRKNGDTTKIRRAVIPPTHTWARGGIPPSEGQKPTPYPKTENWLPSKKFFDSSPPLRQKIRHF